MVHPQLISHQLPAPLSPLVLLLPAWALLGLLSVLPLVPTVFPALQGPHRVLSTQTLVLLYEGMKATVPQGTGVDRRCGPGQPGVQP